jgi:hypothetical protein
MNWVTGRRYRSCRHRSRERGVTIRRGGSAVGRCCALRRGLSASTRSGAVTGSDRATICGCPLAARAPTRKRDPRASGCCPRSRRAPATVQLAGTGLRRATRTIASRTATFLPTREGWTCSAGRRATKQKVEDRSGSRASVLRPRARAKRRHERSRSFTCFAASIRLGGARRSIVLCVRLDMRPGPLVVDSAVCSAPLRFRAV